MTLTIPRYEALAELVEAEPVVADAASYRPRYNVAPTNRHWIARLSPSGTRLLVKARWGVRRDGKPVINARRETVARVPLFRRAFRERRCLVPADGFLEWTGPKAARTPFWFHAPAGGVLLFAGVFEEAEPDGPSFVVLTTAANALVAPIHDRMPVVLGRDEARAWLSEGRPDVLASSADGAFEALEVSPRVSSVANDDPACLEPVERGGGEPRQGELF